VQLFQQGFSTSHAQISSIADAASAAEVTSAADDPKFRLEFSRIGHDKKSTESPFVVQNRNCEAIPACF